MTAALSLSGKIIFCYSHLYQSCEIKALKLYHTGFVKISRVEHIIDGFCFVFVKVDFRQMNEFGHWLMCK